MGGNINCQVLFHINNMNENGPLNVIRTLYYNYIKLFIISFSLSLSIATINEVPLFVINKLFFANIPFKLNYMDLQE